MHKILNILLFLLLSSQAALAAPYVRFWRGTQREDLTSQQFIAGVVQQLVPETIRVGNNRGLIAYLPVLWTPGNSVPEETALVIYSSKEEYDAIRATPEGQAYGALHWDFFKRESSKSSVPVPFTGAFPEGQAVDLFNSDANWQSCYAVATTATNLVDPEEYLNRVVQLKGSYVVSGYALRNAQTYTEYLCFRSEREYLHMSSILQRLRSGILTTAPSQTVELKQGVAGTTFGAGEGLNVRF